MFTLHNATELTKKIVLWGGIGITAIFVLIFLLRGIIAIKNFFIPPGPPPPTMTYGKLTYPRYPANATSEKLTYTINTISGVLPTLPTQMKVYPIIHGAPSLLNLNRAVNEVSQVGFSGAEKKLGDEVYQWNDGSSLNRTLTMNITSENFAMTSEYSTYPTVTNPATIPDQGQATGAATNFLASMKLLPDDIDPSKTVTTLYSLQNEVLTPASSPSTADVVKVNFYQKDLDELPMYYPHPPDSVMNFLVSADNTVLTAEYFHQEIDKTFSTYPIKTAGQAFLDLQKGKGYIASFLGSSNDIRITDVTLGYYLSADFQDYLMPIIVFHGDGNFLAYVTAVPDSYFKK